MGAPAARTASKPLGLNDSTKFAAKGRSVISMTLRIALWATVGAVQVMAKDPTPPAFDTAATSSMDAALPIGAWKIGYAI